MFDKDASQGVACSACSLVTLDPVLTFFRMDLHRRCWDRIGHTSPVSCGQEPHTLLRGLLDQTRSISLSNWSTEPAAGRLVRVDKPPTAAALPGGSGGCVPFFCTLFYGSIGVSGSGGSSSSSRPASAASWTPASVSCALLCSRAHACLGRWPWTHQGLVQSQPPSTLRRRQWQQAPPASRTRLLSIPWRRSWPRRVPSLLTPSHPYSQSNPALPRCAISTIHRSSVASPLHDPPCTAAARCWTTPLERNCVGGNGTSATDLAPQQGDDGRHH